MLRSYHLLDSLYCHLLVPTNICLTIFLKLFFLAYFLTPTNGKQNYPLSKTIVLIRPPVGPDHPDKFELNPWISPAQMDHGVTSGMTNKDLYLIIILTSPPKEKHKTYLIQYVYRHVSLRCIVALCPRYTRTRLPYLNIPPNPK